MWQGYLDTLANLSENVSGMHKAEFRQQAEEVHQQIDAMQAQILAAREAPERWYGLFQTATGPFWQDLSRRLLELIDVGKPAFNLENLRKLQEVAGQIERHHLAVQRTITTLVPWIPLLEDPPALLRQPPYQANFEALSQELPYGPSLREVRGMGDSARQAIQALRQALNAGEPQPAWVQAARPTWAAPLSRRWKLAAPSRPKPSRRPGRTVSSKKPCSGWTAWTVPSPAPSPAPGSCSTATTG